MEASCLPGAPPDEYGRIMRRTAPLIFSLLIAAGCSSAQSAHVSVPPSGATTVTVSETDNGQTIGVRRGGTVTLVLHSTYWQVTGSSDDAVLAADDQPTTTAPPPGTGCVPGGGCGTVTARYTARAGGTATISARRSTCGEAMACRPDQTTYRVTIEGAG